jgi:hypothetical protein
MSFTALVTKQGARSRALVVIAVALRRVCGGLPDSEKASWLEPIVAKPKLRAWRSERWGSLPTSLVNALSATLLRVRKRRQPHES